MRWWVASYIYVDGKWSCPKIMGPFETFERAKGLRDLMRTDDITPILYSDYDVSFSDWPIIGSLQSHCPPERPKRPKPLG